MTDTKTVEQPAITYILYYRQGMSPHPQMKGFLLKGDLQQGIARAKRHCETMGYRFVQLRPFISNLETEEKTHTGVSFE